MPLSISKCQVRVLKSCCFSVMRRMMMKMMIVWIGLLMKGYTKAVLQLISLQHQLLAATNCHLTQAYTRSLPLKNHHQHQLSSNSPAHHHHHRHHHCHHHCHDQNPRLGKSVTKGEWVRLINGECLKPKGHFAGIDTAILGILSN